MNKYFPLLIGFAFLLSGCTPNRIDNEQAGTALFEAIRNHDLETVRDIVSKTSIDLDPPTEPNMVNKALAYASIYGNLEIVKYILAQGVDIDGKIAYGGTALLRAMEVNKLDIARFLIESGADVNIPNAFGVSPMIGSAITCDNDMIDLIINHGGDINQAYRVTTSRRHGEYAYNPIQWAVSRGRNKCVEHLITKGASLDVTTSEGESLLELAKKTHNSDMIALIEQHF